MKNVFLNCALSEGTDQHQLIFAVWRNLGYLTTQLAPREDSDQAAHLRSLIWVFDGQQCHVYIFLRYSSVLKRALAFRFWKRLWV